ncbi:MAG: hypothetical protein CMJ18_08705 [Phycisphaeraceae bacterium]|nr:hypothetical protein [Phycisphaeraceae bacterium]
MFRRRTPPKPAISRQQSFEARPFAVEVLAREPLENGGARLTVPMRPRGYQKWLLRIPEGASRRIDLDAVGAEVFDMCDGRTSVKQIARRFAGKHHVDTHEAGLAVATFIRMMMRKGLVSLAVEREK